MSTSAPFGRGQHTRGRPALRLASAVIDEAVDGDRMRTVPAPAEPTALPGAEAGTNDAGLGQSDFVRRVDRLILELRAARRRAGFRLVVGHPQSPHTPALDEGGTA